MLYFLKLLFHAAEQRKKLQKKEFNLFECSEFFKIPADMSSAGQTAAGWPSERLPPFLGPFLCTLKGIKASKEVNDIIINKKKQGKTTAKSSSPVSYFY